ncbi:MAG: hypothetical protein LBQ01_01075 [Prevotellaceae bacterium]|jgi:hypothetical protein|nr:hypothetical protein [Prevotellaceae bacterium]
MMKKLCKIYLTAALCFFAGTDLFAQMMTAETDFRLLFGSENPAGCAVDGLLVFRDDFGGNKLFAPAGQVYYRQIDGLCAGTKLYFSTWIVSLMNGQNPAGGDRANLIFVIEDLYGNILARYYTGDIQVDGQTRKNYGFEFTVPDSESSVIMKIINTGTGSAENGFALDDIEIRMCSFPAATENKLYDTVCTGTTYTFDAPLNCTGLSGSSNEIGIRWEYKDGKSAGWSTLKTDTVTVVPDMHSTYVINNVAETDSGYYRFVVYSLESSSSSVVSGTVSLSVIKAYRAPDFRAMTEFFF